MHNPVSSMLNPLRSFDDTASLLGRMGTLQTRLARTNAEIRAAQAVRYRVFYEELSATPPPAVRMTRRDSDPFDRHCDHILVIDTSEGREEIVGTYRLILREHAEKVGRFYSEKKYDLKPMLAHFADKRVLELGRSCILPQYRSKRTMELLWHGTWAYALAKQVDIMFGVASFIGPDPKKHAPALAWLGQNACVDEAEDCGVACEHPLPLDGIEVEDFNERRAVASLPPLLKGYLRLGAKVASNAVLDYVFDTIDVLVILKVADINPRYIAHYGADASRFAA